MRASASFTRATRSKGSGAASIASGVYHPFTGPLKKQDGSDWLAEGAVADDGTLAGMNFYVEGIEGEIPK